MRVEPLIVAGYTGLEGGDAVLFGAPAHFGDLIPVGCIGRQKAAGSSRHEMVVAPDAAVIERPAQQFVNGFAEDLAADVPQRHVDTRDRRTQHRAGAVEAVHVHGLPEVLHSHRILPDDGVAEVLDGLHRRPGLALQGGLAPADDTRVGLELDKNVRAVRHQDVTRHPDDLQVGDFQAWRRCRRGGSGGGLQLTFTAGERIPPGRCGRCGSCSCCSQGRFQ